MCNPCTNVCEDHMRRVGPSVSALYNGNAYGRRYFQRGSIPRLYRSLNSSNDAICIVMPFSSTPGRNRTHTHTVETCNTNPLCYGGRFTSITTCYSNCRSGLSCNWIVYNDNIHFTVSTIHRLVHISSVLKADRGFCHPDLLLGKQTFYF